MGIITRQGIYNTIISYAGVLLGIVLTLWLYVTILTPAEYGLTRVMISVAFIGAQFADFGLKNIAIRFFPYYRDEDHAHHGFLFWSLFFSVLGFSLLAILLYTFKTTVLSYYEGPEGLLSQYYGLMVLLTFSTLLFSVLSSYLHSLFNTHFISMLQEVILRLFIIGSLLAYMFGWVQQQGFIMLFVSAYGLLPLGVFIYLAIKRKLYIKIDFSFFNIQPFKKLFVYGFYATLGGVTTLIVSKIDILMLGSMAGLADTGIYAIAFYIGSVISVPQRSINKIARPVIAQSFKTGDLNNIYYVYRKSALTQLILGSLLLIGIGVNIPNLAQIIPSESFREPMVIIVIGLATLFNMATGVNGVIIINSEYFRFDLLANIILLLIAFFSNYLLIPYYGIMGAALATAISIFIYNTVKFIFVWVYFKMQPFTLKTFYVLLICLLTISVNHWLIPDIDDHRVDLLIRSAIIAVVFLGTVIALKLSDDINRIFNRVLGLLVDFSKK